MFYLFFLSLLFNKFFNIFLNKKIFLLKIIWIKVIKKSEIIKNGKCGKINYENNIY